MSKNKHYTVLERKVFLEILNDFKHIIELKKSDTSTLHDKEIAWNEICKRYNESSMISQERTLQQLKKLWTNLKQTQRDLLTKEKQARLATGGGPPPPDINLDPDVATIAPHLMTTAPVIFTSNMTENEIDEKSKDIFNILQDDTGTILYKNILYKNNNDKVNDEIIEIQEDTITEETLDKENEKYDFLNKVNSVKRKGSDNINVQTRKPTKIQKNALETLDNDENAVKIERIKKIMEDEREMADLRKAHENRMIIMKETFHTELYALEIRTATAKAELAELELKKEKEKYMRL